jgi:hypothetical protein
MTVRYNAPVVTSGDYDFDADTGTYVTKVVVRLPTLGGLVEIDHRGDLMYRAGYISIGEDVFIPGYYETARYYRAPQWFMYQLFEWGPEPSNTAGGFDLGFRADGFKIYLTEGTFAHVYVEGY